MSPVFSNSPENLIYAQNAEMQVLFKKVPQNYLIQISWSFSTGASSWMLKRSESSQNFTCAFGLQS